MSDDQAAQRRARVAAITLTVLFALAFVPALIVAGFSIFVFDTPGSGVTHTLYTWGLFLFCLAMPVTAMVGPIMLWKAYRRGHYDRVGHLARGFAVYLGLWLFPFYSVMFS